MNDDVEKLKTTRKRLGWDQAQMAKELGLNRSYLSQLENGARTIQPWVIKRLEEVELGADKGIAKIRSALKDALQGYGELTPSTAAMARACMEYMAGFLERTGQDVVRLAWALDELHRRFPLDKWEPRETAPAAGFEPQGGGLAKTDPAVQGPSKTQ
jgi:transcriptional regulator with XRE-family HTH domain